MSDEIRRMLEQQRALERIVQPVREAQKSLGIDSMEMKLLRREDEQRKLLAGLVDIGGVTSALQLAERHQRSLNDQIEQMKQAGLIGLSSSAQSAIRAINEAQEYRNQQFRMPNAIEISELAHNALASASLAQKLYTSDAAIREAMSSISSPWLQIENTIASAKAFADICSISKGIQSLPAFDSDFSAELRQHLGDWRQFEFSPSTPLVDPVVRTGLYIERGFDPRLTDFPTRAFEQGLDIAGLRSPGPDSDDDIESGCEFQRRNSAYNELQGFEIAVRRFIERVMRDTFGEDWMKHRLPPEMYKAWQEKRAKAMATGQPEHPLIDYADFTDYKIIIERKDNWKDVFREFFVRKEDVCESFQRLFPVRIATMHARLITQDDELLLLVETRRILKVIN